MSRRVTRSMGQVPEEPSQPLASSSKPKSRPLTEEDIQRIKNLLVAFMIHRKRDNSPTDYNDWDQLRPILKEGFDHALKGTGASTSSLNQAQRKWQELCESLVASGVTSWTSLMSGIKKALSQIKYVYENPVEDLLSEGHIRKNIFKHLDLSEIKKLLNRKTTADFSNDEKLDLLSQINDPTSAINDQIHISILEEGSFEFLSSVFNVQADIIDKNGNVTDTAKVDVNVINPTYGTYLESALRANLSHYNYHDQLRGYTFATYLLDSNADASIPLKLDNASRRNTLNAFSLALLNSNHIPIMWDIVKYILRNRPISDFYHPKVDSPHAFGKYNTISPYQRTIDLVWIIKNLSMTQINWLITHGKLDLRTMIEDYEIALDAVKDIYKQLKTDLDRHEQQRIELKTRYDALVKKVADKKIDIEPYQTQYIALQNKRTLIQQLRDTHNVRGGRKGKQRK